MYPEKTTMNRRSGGMMVTAVVTILLLAILGTAMVALTRISGQRGAQHNFSERAYYMAQSGLAFARSVAATNVTYTTPEVFTLAPGEHFELLLTNDAQYAYARVVGKAGVGGAWEAHHGPLALAIPLPPPPPPPEPPPPPPPPPPPDPPNPVVDEQVFVYGTTIIGGGSANVVGEGATIVLTSNLDVKDIGGGTDLEISSIFVGGNLVMTTGNSNLGSPDYPGVIFVAGNAIFARSGRNVYGDVYVHGNFEGSQGTLIHGNVYVQGAVVLGQQGVWLADGKNIYYRGGFSTHNNVEAWVVARCIQDPNTPRFTPPTFGTLELHPDNWYTSRGYASSGALTSNMKIFADNYSSTVARPPATNVIIVSKGDITISGTGDNLVSGVLFAPSGMVTFGGDRFEGTVIAKDGFTIGRPNALITFIGIERYITNYNDYPFVVK